MPVKGQLTPAEKLAAQLIALGHSLADAADESGITLPVLRKRMDFPLFAAEIERWRSKCFASLQESLAARLEKLQHPALETMASLMQAESESVQFQASKDLLNRGPLAPKPAYGGGMLPEGGAAIHLDQKALEAILFGARNAGQHAIVAAFAALPQPAPMVEQPVQEP